MALLFQLFLLVAVLLALLLLVFCLPRLLLKLLPTIKRCMHSLFGKAGQRILESTSLFSPVLFVQWTILRFVKLWRVLTMTLSGNLP